MLILGYLLEQFLWNTSSFQCLYKPKRLRLFFVIIWVMFDVFVDFLTELLHAASALGQAFNERTLNVGLLCFFGRAEHIGN